MAVTASVAETKDLERAPSGFGNCDPSPRAFILGRELVPLFVLGLHQVMITTLIVTMMVTAAMMLPRVTPTQDDGQVVTRAMKDPQPRRHSKDFTPPCVRFRYLQIVSDY
jgi:hypothetical protein